MIINPSLLSIPPYISTSWEQIAFLHVETDEKGLLLVISMTNQEKIKIPALPQKILEMIFLAHAHFLHNQEALNVGAESSTFTFPINEDQTENGLLPALQHNPDQTEAPDLPIGLLSKIQELSSLARIEDPNQLPTPEPHCNCLYCQLAKAVREGASEEIVRDEELTFRQFNIKQTDEKLYRVSHPEEADIEYQVCLGDSVGCTCGRPGCEHIRAVLNS